MSKYLVRYKEEGEWHSAWFETEEAAEVFFQHAHEHSGLTTEWGGEFDR